jgi:hypothetical protein
MKGRKKQMRVGINHEFFEKGLNDYASWRDSWVREIGQNSADCGAATIKFEFSQMPDGDTLAVAENDGPPMDEKTLLDKFLCLGGTTKDSGDSVGGFGVAKVVIALAHKSYRIDTGTCRVSGAGGDFEIEQREYFPGTRTEVVMRGDQVAALHQAVRDFITYAQLDCEIVLDGERHHPDLRKGMPRRDLGFATVYTNRTHPHTMVVRIGGIPMFTEYVSINRGVIVELKGKSSDVLTANRDGLIRPYSSQLSAFVTELAVDKRSALKSRRPHYRHYAGERLRHVTQHAVSVRDLVGEVTGAQPETIETPSCGGTPVAAAAFSPHQRAPARPTGEIGHEFIIKNETGLEIPRYFLLDGGEFSPYSRKLVRVWGRILLTLHQIFDHEAEFAIGFVFDADAEAQFEEGRYGAVYYVNPVTVVEQRSSGSRSFRKRFRLTERDRLISVAAHEFVHGGCGYRYHDESFAGKQTDIMAVVMKHRRRFNWCFQ